MTTGSKVVVAVVALILVLTAGATAAVVLVGDDSPEPSPPDSSAAAPTTSGSASSTAGGDVTTPPSPDLTEFYSQQIDWQPCGSNDCGRLTVPLDYDQPEGETIELALLRVPARDPDAKVGSLVVNPGGPGAPGTEYAAQADFVFRDPILDHFDIVGFDPRGTGSSDPVDCLTDAQLDDFLAADPDPDNRAEGRAFAASFEQLFAGCVARSDALIGHVTTIEAARDMDVLRAALGESTLTYFGASYGTKLGATYAELFPDWVGRLVLDGAVDVSLPSRQLSLGQAGGFETALRAYVADCVEAGSCFLGDSVEEGLDRIQQLLADVETDPLPTGTDRELRVGNAFYGVVTPLYNRAYWPILSQALQAAFDGDGSALLELSDLYASRGEDGYEDNSAEAIYAINCLDDPYAIGPAKVPSQYDDFLRVSPTFGRVFAWGLVGCRGIRVKSSEQPLDIRAEGAAPIVVIGTTRDPATPYAWAKALADQLESGVLVSRDGDGHTGYNAGNPCVDVAVEDYLVDGTVPDDGLRC